MPTFNISINKSEPIAVEFADFNAACEARDQLLKIFDNKATVSAFTTDGDGIYDADGALLLTVDDAFRSVDGEWYEVSRINLISGQIEINTHRNVSISINDVDWDTITLPSERPCHVDDFNFNKLMEKYIAPQLV